MKVQVQYGLAGDSASTIARSLEDAVRAGRIAPGAAMPTVRALAAALGVSPATVAAAYRTARTRGLLSAAGRRGTRVNPRPALAVPPPAPVPAHLRNLADGNPDPALLPPLAIARPVRPRLYGEAMNDPALLALAARGFAADGIATGALGVVGGALDGIERVLGAWLRPGDRVAIEDPGFVGVLDLVGALGLVAEPVAVDDAGPRPDALAAAVRAGARALIVTPRAQNPTGAALDVERVRALGRVLERAPELLVIEDDHVGAVAGQPAHTLGGRRERWAVVRSVSKWLGPDLRVAVLAGDATTVARVEGRQRLGVGWVSHLLQTAVARLWSDRGTQALLRAATAAYARRRRTLVAALAHQGVAAHARSGLNVWVPVADEERVVAGLAERGWAVRGGARFRLRTPPAIRVTVATLRSDEAARFAMDLARTLQPAGHTRAG
ncbi:MAG: aminotransferase class I/II-fold pyridoxal phosphate-dependent enzyme [Candidatus Binatia bacterium]